MINDIKNVFLAGVGAVASTYEKADSVVKQFVEKGKLTVDEGKELSEELKRNFDTSTGNTMNKINNTISSVKPTTKDEVREIVEEYGFCYKGEYDILTNKVSELQKRIEELEKKLEGSN